MIKIISFLFIFISFTKADYQIIKNDNLFLVEVKNSTFEDILINLKDEINYQGFTVVYELNLAKATNEIAEVLNKKGTLKNGTNLGICKSSFTFAMVKENYNNINYCPLGLSIYSHNNKSIYLSYKINKAFKQDDIIYSKINETLKKLILDSLD